MKILHYGFTLIELVITLSTVLLIAGLAVPGFTHLHRSVEAR